MPVATPEIGSEQVRGPPILGSVITTTGLELRAGARILLSDVNLRVQPGDRIGLVGRNGAGKTTTLTTLSGERAAHAGSVDVVGAIGYLPQDPRSGDLDISASDRVLSGRGLDALRAQLVKAQVAMAEPADDDERDRAVRRYGRLEDQFAALGGLAVARQHARERGLAGAVAADEADLVALVDAEGDVGHQDARAEAQLHIGDGEHGVTFRSGCANRPARVRRRHSR
jgi:ATPase subunit of ABC transporter with duplicated ATPase domains